MSKELRDSGFVHEQPTEAEDTRDFCECRTWPRDVIAGPKVDDHVEGAILKRQGAHITLDQRGGNGTRGQLLARLSQRVGVEIEANQACRATQSCKAFECDSTSTAHFEHMLTLHEPECPH